MPLGNAFSSGFSSGSQAVTSAGQLKIQQQLAEQQKREQFMKEYQGKITQAVDILNKGVQNIYATSKDPGTDIQKLKTVSEGIIKGLVTEGQLLGTDPQLTTQLFQNVFSQPSPVEKGKVVGEAEGAAAVGKAEVIEDKVGGGQKNIEKLLGIQKPSSTEFLQLIDARDSASPQDKEVIQQRINKLVSQGSGEPSVQKNIVLPIISKALRDGTESLTENEWDALALASRTKGVDLLIEQNVRAILKDRQGTTDTVKQNVPEQVLQGFQNDKSIPKGSTLGNQRANGKWEVVKDGKIIGEYAP